MGIWWLFKLFNINIYNNININTYRIKRCTLKFKKNIKYDKI